MPKAESEIQLGILTPNKEEELGPLKQRVSYLEAVSEIVDHEVISVEGVGLVYARVREDEEILSNKVSAMLNGHPDLNAWVEEQNGDYGVVEVDARTDIFLQMTLMAKPEDILRIVVVNGVEKEEFKGVRKL